MTMTKKQRAAGPRLTKVEAEAAVRKYMQEGADRVCALIAFMAKKHPDSAWAHSKFVHNALISGIFLPEQYQIDDKMELIVMARKLPGTILQDFHSSDAHFLAKLVEVNEVPSYDLEVLGRVNLTVSDYDDIYYVVRSGMTKFYVHNVKILDDASQIQDELETLQATVKSVEDLLAL